MPSVPVRYTKTTGLNYNQSAAETIDKVILRVSEIVDNRMIYVPSGTCMIEYVTGEINSRLQQVYHVSDDIRTQLNDAISVVQGKMVEYDTRLAQHDQQIAELQTIIRNLQNPPN